MIRPRPTVITGLITLMAAAGAVAQQDSLVRIRNDSIAVRFSNADLRTVVQALGRYLDRPIILGTIAEYRITLETPQPIPRAGLAGLLEGMLAAHGLKLVESPGFYTIGAPDAPPPAEAGGTTAPIQLYVLHLRHAKATDVAATVNSLYGRSSALGEVGANKPTLDQALRQNLVPPVDSSVPAPMRPVTQLVAELSGDVTIIPDPRTNNLLVRATKRDFDLISAAVQQIDVRPLQVLIEVVVAEVRRDRSLGFGVETQIKGKDVTATTSGFGLGDLVIKVLQLGRVDLAATLGAAASRGNATILSRPTILATNNETAEILVGSQRPFVQVQRALPTDTPSRDQVVQFRDVGTRLRVQPTISDDGYIALQVSQEVSAATAEVAFDAPVISTRTIQTRLLVRDGHTAVLGGLTDTQRELTRSGIPVLSSIPILGGLFGKQISRTVETELFVFLTPRLIRSDSDLDDAAAHSGDKTQPLLRGLKDRPRAPLPADSTPPPSRSNHLAPTRG